MASSQFVLTVLMGQPMVPQSSAKTSPYREYNIAPCRLAVSAHCNEVTLMMIMSCTITMRLMSVHDDENEDGNSIDEC